MNALTRSEVYGELDDPHDGSSARLLRGIAFSIVPAIVLWAAILGGFHLTYWAFFGEKHRAFGDLTVPNFGPAYVVEMPADITITICTDPFSEVYRRSIRWPVTCARKA